jgi:MinD superfamily P-loop ATPase
MIISVASGKGGTGKTTIATNLAAALADEVQLLDCDVEAPNAGLFLQPVMAQSETVYAPVPIVDHNRCTLCGKCDEICQFNAIVVIGKTVMPFHELCHSCGGCLRVCPDGAISETGRELGVIESGQRNGIEFIHGRLRIGEAMSPPLIEKVRDCADHTKTVIIDAPPGTSCPVITSIKNTDFILLVTEPTPFGLHDLKLAVGAVRVLGLPAGLVINRCDIGDDRVRSYAREQHLPVLMEIPFDRKIAEAYSSGDLLVEALPGWRDRFTDLYAAIRKLAKKTERAL